METPLADIRIGQVTDQWAKTQKIPSQYSESIASTSTKAKTEAFSEQALSEHLILYIAEKQTGGRGRGTNSWSSASLGSQLLSTWSFMVESAPHPTVSPMMGLALYRAANSTWPFLNWNLKAPNDLYIGNKKAAGILLETLSQGDDQRLLIGLGLNVISHPAEVETSTSIAEELSKATPLLAQDWICFLERLVFEFSFSLQLSFEPLNSTSAQSLLHALNLHPHLKEKYTGLDAEGNLQTPSRKISWMEL